MVRPISRLVSLLQTYDNHTESDRIGTQLSNPLNYSLPTTDSSTTRLRSSKCSFTFASPTSETRSLSPYCRQHSLYVYMTTSWRTMYDITQAADRKEPVMRVDRVVARVLGELVAYLRLGSGTNGEGG
jgi:hypothetical protein